MNKIEELKKEAKNFKVLYAEDDLVAANEISTLLKKLIPNVITAHNGSEALALYKQEKNFDFVITDIDMPIMSGIDLIKEIRKISPLKKIIITTAHNEYDYLEELLNLGIENFLLKPIELNRIIEVLYSVVKNINNQKNIEKLKLLEIQFNATTQLIHDISHHWRQPLNIISIIAGDVEDIIENEGCNSKYIIKSMNKIIENTENLSKTLNNFKNIYSDNKQNSYLVNEIVDNVVNLFKNPLIEENIELNIYTDEKIYINCNKIELAQVIIELIKNAREKMYDSDISKKYINISLQANKSDVIFLIEDNGGGIKEEILDKIFEPYFSTKKDLNGTGMGLYIAKKYIEKNMCGKITAQNYNLGTLITITIPRENIYSA